MGPHKTALVLSGGFARGAAHLGLAVALFEKDILPDIYIGTSIGSVIAVLLNIFDTPHDAMDFYLKTVKDFIWPHILGFELFSNGGILDPADIVGVIAKKAGVEGSTFDDLRKYCFITSTDLNSGGQIVFGPNDKILLTDAIEASIAVPGIFKPKKMILNGKSLALADGGILDSCPIVLAAKAGADRIIAIDLGYCGQNKGDHNDKPAAEILLQAFDLTQSFSHLAKNVHDVIFAEGQSSVRIINPAIDIGPFDIGKTEDVIKGSYEFGKTLLSYFDSAEAFFSQWPALIRSDDSIRVRKMADRGDIIEAVRAGRA
jgi:NTE family protein